MSNLLDRLSQGEVLVGDGAMGTMLLARGLKSGQCPERMNLDHPEVLEEIASAYFEAGSDIISTNTFGGSALKLAQYGLDGRTEEINAAAVMAVRNVVGRERCLALSVGPCGHLLEPYGDVTPDQVTDGFARQLSGALSQGADLICVETMTDLAEATLAISAAQELAPDIPIATTMTFDVTTEGMFTIMGVTVAQAVEELSDAGASIIGSNCGNGIENMIKIAGAFRELTDLPILIQSNAGLPELDGEELIYKETPEYMAERCRELLDLKVNIIGGCCGTTPNHIAAIRALVDSRT